MENNVSVVQRYSYQSKEQLYLLHPILHKWYVEETAEMFLASIVVEAPVESLGRCLQDLGSQSTTNDEVFSIYEAYGNAVEVVIILRVSNMGHKHPKWDQRPVEIADLAGIAAQPARFPTHQRREFFVFVVWGHSHNRHGIEDVVDVGFVLEVFRERPGLNAKTQPHDRKSHGVESSWNGAVEVEHCVSC